MSQREQTTEPLRDKIAQVLREHVPFEHDWGVDGDCICGFVTPKWDDFAAYSDHVADAVVESLGLTEERRTLTDGWIQPFRNAGYISQGLKPPPAVITHEVRWVSGWSVVGGEPSE